MSFDLLLEKAKSVLKYRKLSDSADAGGVAAAILTDKGNIYVGVCIDTACGMGFCAEHSAAAAMITAGENVVKKMVAVNSEGRILPPCGRCREFISQIGTENMNAEIMVNEGVAVKLSELLPYDWRT